MRYLVISDLHSNWQALEAVLADVGGAYDKIVCCGDLVGYGPDPGLVVEWVRANVEVVIRGNHDRACCGLEDLEWFNPVAQIASRWTMSHMTETDLAWLRELPQGPVTVDGFSLVHGSPLDEDEYVTSIEDAANVIDYVAAPVTFFGHTHLQGGFAWLNGAEHRFGSALRMKLEMHGLYLINPGSVGQPRDGDSRAAYALFDTGTSELSLGRVAYDYALVRRKIERAGLPPVLGTRLEMGR